MDSHGKPGIAGNTIGVETEIVVELLVVVGVLTTVKVETEVLTTVVVSELVAVMGSVVLDVLLVGVLLCEVEDVSELELVLWLLVCVLVCGCTVFWNDPGGSR